MTNEMMTIITVAWIVLAVLGAILIVILAARFCKKHHEDKLKTILKRYEMSDREVLLITTEMFHRGKLKVSIKDTKLIDMLSGKA